jgi:hypothetical protein
MRIRHLESIILARIVGHPKLSRNGVSVALYQISLRTGRQDKPL